jgi:hypothetical protein
VEAVGVVVAAEVAAVEGAVPERWAAAVEVAAAVVALEAAGPAARPRRVAEQRPA